MIAGIEAFRRRRSAFVPLSPSVPQTQGTRGTNRGGLSPMSPMSPQENSLKANETTNAAQRVTPERTDESDGPTSACLPTDEAEAFWSTFLARVTECDELINSLCDLRGDDDARRADLLAVRKRMAPQKIDGDIAYLKAEIATLAPAPASPATGRCPDCLHFVRVGVVGERCSHPERSPPGEPERADCLPENECEKFIFWCPQSRGSTL